MKRPIYIYWLLDIRPEMIAEGHHSGYPFYCGKTVHQPQKRLRQHQTLASKRGQSFRDLAQRLNICGSNVRVRVMEVVPPDSDWADKEKRWIKLIRFCWPEGNCNVSSGGEDGTMTEEHKQNLRERLKLTYRCMLAKKKREDKAREARKPSKRLMYEKRQKLVRKRTA